MNNQAEKKIKKLTWDIVGGIENAISDGDEEYFFWNDLTTEQKVSEIYNDIISDLEKEVRFIGTTAIKETIEKYL